MILVFDPAHREMRTWSHGEIDGLCFIATISSPSTGQADRAAILGCAYELRHYLLTATNVSIKYVHMLCPPSISGRGSWALEELKSVITFRSTDSDDSAVVYKTAVASYKLGDLDLRRRKIARTIYSTQQLLDHTPMFEAHRASAQGNHLFATLWAR